MKLTASTYVSPKRGQGTFTNVEIEDTKIVHETTDNKLQIDFTVTYEHNGVRKILDVISMKFWGLTSEIESGITSNETTFMDYEENGETIYNIPFFGYLEATGGIPPAIFTITNYGYPTYEKALLYFTGGNFTTPKISITDPLAVGFILTKMNFNGEPVGVQFAIV